MEALRAAFLELIGSRALETISIKDICDHAGLSYPTFYRRFASKEELLASIAAQEVRQLISLSPGGGDTPERRRGSSAAMCEYVEAHRTLWRTLLTRGAAGAMRQEFMRVSRDIAETQPRNNPWLPIDLAVPFVASGMFEILSWWMMQPDDYPTRNVVILIDALIVETTARPRPVSME